MQRRSLYRLVLWWLLLPLVLILLAGGLYSYRFAVKTALNVYDLGLLDDALDLSKQIVAEHGRFAIELPLAARQMLQENNGDRVIYAAWDSTGKLFSGSPELMGAIQEPVSRQPRFADLTLAGESQRVVVLRGHSEGQGYTIAVAQTLRGYHRLVEGIFAGILLPEALLALVSVAIILFGVRVALAPVDSLRREIVSRSSTDLSPIDEKAAPADLVPIIHGINELLDKLSGAFASHRRFIADAAHQLRTPLASLSSQIEVGLEKSNTDPRPLLNNLLSTTRRTTHLANQLLSLARLEHTEQHMMESATFSLDQLIREVSADFVALGARRDVDLEFSLEPNEIQGSPLLVRELVSNLIDNAIRYCAKPGWVEVVLKKNGGHIELVIQDNGPGVVTADLDRLGTPFHRLTTAQNEGCGLGLAIVREIARLHDANIGFAAGRQAGLAVTVRFRPVIRSI